MAAFAVVVALHAALAVWMLRSHERPAPPPEPRTIVARLLSVEPARPVAAPAPAPPVPLTPLTPPIVRQRPAPAHPVEPLHPAPPRVRQKPAVAPTPVHREAPESERRTPATAPVPTPAPPTPSATAAPPAAPSTAPAAAPDTAQRSAPAQPSLANAPPKDVSHVDCNITQPDYPDAARRRGESGTAIVRFVVGVDGRVESAKIQQSSGYARLDDAALGALRGSTCRPFKEAGVPVRVAYAQPFVFGLGN